MQEAEDKLSTARRTRALSHIEDHQRPRRLLMRSVRGHTAEKMMMRMMMMMRLLLRRMTDINDRGSGVGNAQVCGRGLRGRPMTGLCGVMLLLVSDVVAAATELHECRGRVAILWFEVPRHGAGPLAPGGRTRVPVRKMVGCVVASGGGDGGRRGVVGGGVEVEGGSGGGGRVGAL